MNNGQVLPMQSMPAVQAGGDGVPIVRQSQDALAQNKSNAGLMKTIVIILVSLVALTFIGLFIWMFVQYNDVSSDVDYQVSVAVAAAKDEQRAMDEEEYFEREKNPYKTFAGPADYGQLTFQYPKTWSVYIGNDASNGSDFSAYFNPDQVYTVSKDTINALRVIIRNKSFEDVTEEYQKIIEKKGSNLTFESIVIGDEEKGVSVTANRYAGTIPNTDLSGYIVVFKIRDKTAILQTDSVLFEEDFDRLLDTIVFNA